MIEHDLFISHSSSDADQARALRGVLESGGYTCWMAPDDVTGTDPWATQILAAIDGCRAMLVVISARSNASAHVAREVELAIGRGRAVLPVRVEDVRPAGPLEYHLTGLQRIDAFPPPIASHRDLILRRVGTALPREEGAPVASGPPNPPPPISLPPDVVTVPPAPVEVGPASRPRPGIGAWARANSMLAGVAVTLAALFAVGAVAMALGGPGATPTARQTGTPASITAAVSPSPPASIAPPSIRPVPSRSRPAVAAAGAFPNPAEVDLFMTLPYFAARDIGDCSRVGSELVGSVAHIECYAANGELVFYGLWADVATLRTEYRTQLRVNMDNPVGSCATAPVGDAEWRRDGQVAGRLACQLWDGGPSVTFYWTDEARLVTATWYGVGDFPEVDRAKGYALFLAWTAE